MQVAAVVLVALLGIAVVLLTAHARQKRRTDLAAVAGRLGLEFAPEDPFDLTERPFALFARGDGRGAQHVMWGVRHDVEVVAFDYWYYENVYTPKVGTTRSYRHFSCAVAALDLTAPHLVIEPENPLTRLADALGFDDLTFESGDFNRRYQVRGDDRRFASYLIDARMIEWLLAAHGWSFELHGREVLCYSDRLRPRDVAAMIDALVGFTAQIPRAARDVYREGTG